MKQAVDKGLDYKNNDGQQTTRNTARQCVKYQLN